MNLDKAVKRSYFYCYGKKELLKMQMVLNIIILQVWDKHWSERYK
jgi:hypothetical protein